MRNRVLVNISEHEAEGENIKSGVKSIKELQNILAINRNKLDKLG